MILNRYRPGVPFYNALFIHQRQVCVDRTYLGYHATAWVLWEKGNDGMEVGLVERRILRFQFLIRESTKQFDLSPLVKKPDAHFLFYIHLFQNLNKFCKRYGAVSILISLLDGPVCNAAQLFI